MGPAKSKALSSYHWQPKTSKKRKETQSGFCQWLCTKKAVLVFNGSTRSRLFPRLHSTLAPSDHPHHKKAINGGWVSTPKVFHYIHLHDDGKTITHVYLHRERRHQHNNHVITTLIKGVTYHIWLIELQLNATQNMMLTGAQMKPIPFTLCIPHTLCTCNSLLRHLLE